MWIFSRKSKFHRRRAPSQCRYKYTHLRVFIILLLLFSTAKSCEYSPETTSTEKYRPIRASVPLSAADTPIYRNTSERVYVLIKKTESGARRATAAVVAAAGRRRRRRRRGGYVLSCGGSCYGGAECWPEDRRRRRGPPTAAPARCHTSRRHRGPHTRPRARLRRIQRRRTVPRACNNRGTLLLCVRSAHPTHRPPSRQRLTNKNVLTHAHVRRLTTVVYSRGYLVIIIIIIMLVRTCVVVVVVYNIILYMCIIYPCQLD